MDYCLQSLFWTTIRINNNKFIVILNDNSEFFVLFLTITGKILGKGEFGCVWLGLAEGISEFRPRDILKQKSNRWRFSVSLQGLRRKSHGRNKNITEVAVKKVIHTKQVSLLLEFLKL